MISVGREGALLAALGALVLVGGAALAVPVDGDGLSSIRELALGTNPLTGDTDGDGLHDGHELRLRTDPLTVDTDGDGLSDGDEVAIGTDPIDADTDGDGIRDGTERSVGLTPTRADTDGDGVGDGLERRTGTDPTRSNTDGDGLSDAREVYGDTDPTGADTDGDGIPDGQEADSRTSPTMADTDGDGLHDGRELELGTEPVIADTDGDGLHDGREQRIGTDPLTGDTDGDYLTDGMEVRATETLPNASALRRDVYVELDFHPACDVPRDQLDRVEERFASAPIDNPGGTQGIDLHVRIDGPVDSFDPPAHADYRGKGHFYGMLVRSVGSNVVLGSAGRTGFRVQCRNTGDFEVGTIFMHELGHTLGLSPVDYRGIDSRSVPFDEYPSVMNYNTPPDYYQYSSGTGFDDWRHIAAEQPIPRTGRIDLRERE